MTVSINGKTYEAGELVAYVQKLEKENAELKAFKQDCIKLTEDNVVMARQRAEMAEQLTKAKKLLNEFLDFESSCMERGIYISDKIRTEAKQFLSEVEK